MNVTVLLSITGDKFREHNVDVSENKCNAHVKVYKTQDVSGEMREILLISSFSENQQHALLLNILHQEGSPADPLHHLPDLWDHHPGDDKEHLQ